MQYAKGGSCRTSWVWINVYWLETLSPNPGSTIQCASRVGLGSFYILWTRVAKTILAAVDSIWDAGGQEKKLREQTMLLLWPALSHSCESLLGRKSPLKKAVMFLRMPSQAPIHTRKGAFGRTKKKGGGTTILPAHSSPNLPNNKRSLVPGASSLCHLTTVDSKKYIMNMKYATCNM